MKRDQQSNPAQEDTLFRGTSVDDSRKLGVVRARFVGHEHNSFEDLVSGYSSMRVLTYSNSLSMISRTAALLDDLEIVFGREDIVGEAEILYWYQDELVRAVRDQIKSADPLRKKIEAGNLRLFVVKDLVSHEKLFLLEAEDGNKRVLTGSANFSERAFSGKQNEGYVLYDDDDAAWDYYRGRYERLKAASALGVPKRALLSEELDVGDLPAFSEENGAQIVAVEDSFPENGIVRKIVSSKTPKHFAGLSSVVTKSKGSAHLDRKTRSEAVTYMKSNLRTTESNPEEYMSIDVASGTVELSGKQMDLDVPEGEVRADVEAWIEYFDGFSAFRGENEKLARDYFAFWSWLWFGPLLCDLRNAARSRHEDVQDYPLFGILYGMSNCGKSELIDTLLLSMFGKSGATPTEWFTRNRVANLMAENHRYPLVFDDLERKRYSDYAVSLIKEDHVRLPEYPPVVLSMNATTQDTFETEVRKRCFVVYTGASLPDDAPEFRELSKKVSRLKHDLTTSLYREYLKRVLARLQQEVPTDFLGLSSGVLQDLISEHGEGGLPDWCRATTIDEHRRGRHDKVREDLRQLRIFDETSWEHRGNKWVLRMPDHNAANRLRRDVPDYLLSTGNVGNLVVFDAGELESFLGGDYFPQGKPLRKIARFLKRP
jgi:hypothetical protein